MKNIFAVTVLCFVCSQVLADPAPVAPASAPTQPAPKTLTIEEGRQLYDLGVTTGMAQAAMQAAQAKAKSAIDKLR